MDSLESGSLLGKWITVGKYFTFTILGQTLENWSHLEKWDTLGKMGYTWKIGSHFEKGLTF